MKRLVCALSGAAIGFVSVAPFLSVSASASVSTVTLTTAQTVALFGQTIDCEYLSTDGTYKPITATYAGNVSITGGEYFSPDGQTFEGRSFIQYSLPYKSDMQTAPSEITIYFKTAVDLSSVAYVDSALVQLSNMSFQTQILGTYTDYWYTSAGYFYPLAQDDTEPGSNLYGRLWNDPSYSYTIIPAFYNGEASTFSTGWAKCGSFKDTTYASDYYIGIVCPILSDSYQFDGNTGAGPGSGESSGGGSDSGSDLSGITSRLDQIIALLDEIADNDSESSGSGSDSESDALMSQFDSDMDYISSGLNQLDGLAAAADSVTFEDAQYTEIYGPIRDLVGVAPSEQSQFSSEDSTEAWLREELEGVSNPFFVTMQVTALIALISFVIFGKRGGG